MICCCPRPWCCSSKPFRVSREIFVRRNGPCTLVMPRWRRLEPSASLQSDRRDSCPDCELMCETSSVFFGRREGPRHEVSTRLKSRWLHLSRPSRPTGFNSALGFSFNLNFNQASKMDLPHSQSAANRLIANRSNFRFFWNVR